MEKLRKKMNKIYKDKDPFRYQINPSDENRKKVILDVLSKYAPFKRALDIGCGEGWITKDLPAKKIYGFDISCKARKKCPKPVIPIGKKDINGKYDLIVATGVMYKGYYPELIVEIINKYSSGIVLLCNIFRNETEDHKNINGKRIFNMTFDYVDGRYGRQELEVLKVYDTRLGK